MISLSAVARGQSRNYSRGVAALLLALLLPATVGTLRTASAEEPAAPSAARAGSLSVTPSIYVAGQAVRFRGTVGAPGRRTVHLQSHMNRPGDTWLRVPSSTFRTSADGRFDFTFTAPSMSRISYRVAGPGVATRSYVFNARPQEITLTLPGVSADSPSQAVPPLRPFTVLADTTPAVRSALGTPPPIPGRTVLLQERRGNQWQTIQQGATDSAGHAYFHVTAPASGERVLRARQERYTAGMSRIGWYASFPTYFTVRSRDETTPTSSRAGRTIKEPIATVAKSAVRPTASERYGWGPTIFDFAWERGQDLTSPPSKGTRLQGTWLDTSDGTGRAAPFNGALVLQSKLKHAGIGDRGTTAATMRDNSRSVGRWEFRLQGFAWEAGPRPYRFRLDLVPVGTSATPCPTEGVVVADVTMGSPGVSIGIRSQSERSVWKRRLTDLRLGETPFNVAVEVAAKHTTWFVDGKPVGTVKGGEAHLGSRLVPRLSLVGAQTEMNGAEVGSDWQRGWALAKGKQVSSGPALPRTAYAAC